MPLAKITKRYPFNVVVDTVQSINSSENKVVCAENTFTYDYLVVAFGAHKMKHKGIENTLSICGKPEISISIRDRIDELIAVGSGTIAVGFGGNPKDKSAVRGGPAFELMFNIHNLLKKKGIRDNFNLSFFAPMAEPGAKMGPGSVPMLNRMFDKYGIEKRFGKKIVAFDKHGVQFEDGSTLEADVTLFIPASAGHSLLSDSDLPLTEAGFVKIDTHCRVEGTVNVFAVGDIAAIEGPEWIAKQGHVAELMGQNAAHNILALETGKSTMKHYHESPSIICVMESGNELRLCSVIIVKHLLFPCLLWDPGLSAVGVVMLK